MTERTPPAARAVPRLGAIVGRMPRGAALAAAVGSHFMKAPALGKSTFTGVKIEQLPRGKR